MHVTADHPAHILRPFIWVAGLAFSTGFLGYLAIGGRMIQGG